MGPNLLCYCKNLIAWLHFGSFMIQYFGINVTSQAILRKYLLYAADATLQLAISFARSICHLSY